MQDIRSVVRLCQEGHLDAFTDLFSHYQNRVYDLACAILRDEAWAEDVVQDTFLAVFRKIGDFRGDASFDTWLTAIAVNQCRQRLRRRKIRNFLSLDRLSPRRAHRIKRPGEDLADTIHAKRQRETLWDMVDRLPTSQRLPMILRYRYALPCGDIAEILDRRTSTIYQALNSGRRRLRQMAQDREGETQAGIVEIVG
jgi:RNA polymerase sigma-70 factor (ECF subfamily)